MALIWPSLPVATCLPVFVYNTVQWQLLQLPHHLDDCDWLTYCGMHHRLDLHNRWLQTSIPRPAVGRCATSHYPVKVRVPPPGARYVPSLQPIEWLRFYCRHAEKQQRVSLFISFYNQYSSHDPSRSVSVQLVLSPCCHTHRDRMRQNATHVSHFWCHRFNHIHHNQPWLFLLPSSFAFGASTLFSIRLLEYSLWNLGRWYA